MEDRKKNTDTASEYDTRCGFGEYYFSIALHIFRSIVHSKVSLFFYTPSLQKLENCIENVVHPNLHNFVYNITKQCAKKREIKKNTIAAF